MGKFVPVKESVTRTWSVSVTTELPGWNAEKQVQTQLIYEYRTVTMSIIVTAAVWGEWSEWEECSLSCGSGTRIRTRTCESSNCVGVSSESGTCNEDPCQSTGNVVIQVSPLNLLITIVIIYRFNEYSYRTVIITK